MIAFGTNFQVGSDYNIVGPLGQGAYGVVVAARVMNIGALPSLMDDNSPLLRSASAGDEMMTRGSLGENDEDCSPMRGNEMVAIKKIMLEGFTAGMIRRTLRELKILRLL